MAPKNRYRARVSSSWLGSPVAASSRIHMPPAFRYSRSSADPITAETAANYEISEGVIVTNVDRLFIVCSAAEPRLKPNLIDRLLVTAEKAAIKPIICINKIDLVDPDDDAVYAGTADRLTAIFTREAIESLPRDRPLLQPF